jgi:glycosyltransferase involved in cell wall biosynthesis
MRVVQVSDIRLQMANGVYMAVAGLAAHLPKAGIELEAWHLSTAAKVVGQRQVAGVTVYDLPAHGNTTSLALGLPAVTREFIRRRQEAVDLVHFHSVFIPNHIWMSRLVTKPYVLTPHGGYGQNVLDGSRRLAKALWLARYERSFQRNAEFIHAVSEAERDELAGRWPDLCVRYVPNAVELPPPQEADASRDFVFIGRLSLHQKGLDRLIRGFARFAADPAAAGYRLVIAGPDWRGGRAHLERLIAQLNLGSQVVLAGSVFGEAKAKLLLSAHAFVLTSRWEGMPVSILESLAHSTPVIVTRETNIGDMVRRYGAGLEVVGSEEAIAEGLLHFAQATPDAMRSCRSAARKLVEENFTWPVIVGQLVDLYRQVVDKRTHVKSWVNRPPTAGNMDAGNLKSFQPQRGEHG